MKTGLQVLIFLLFYTLTATSQVNRYGTPLISWFDAAQTPGEPGNLCITMDSCGVMYFGNEGGGIVTYDGSKWLLTGTPGISSVKVLITDNRGVVFAGGRNDFGILRPDERGRLRYRSLAGMIAEPDKAVTTGTIISAAADSNHVWFTDGRKLYRCGQENDSVTVTNLETDYGLGNVSAMVAFDRMIILADGREGLFAYGNDTITRVTGGEKMALSGIVRLLPYDRDNLLIGARGRDLMLFNIRSGNLNEHFSDRAAEEIMRSGSLSDLAIIPGNMIAAGFSRQGGIYIFSRDGRLHQVISGRTSELRESSVTAMYCDYRSNSQLWFCTGGFINRGYVSLPASEFNRASGLSSVSGTILGFDGSVYAGTDNGLLVDYTDRSGTRRFMRAGEFDSPVNELITAELSDGKMMIAATGDGLLQLDENDDLELFLPGIGISTVCHSDEEIDVILAGSTDGIIRKLGYDGYEWTLLHAVRLDESARIRDIQYSSPGEWWIMTENPSSVVRMSCESNDTAFFIYGRQKGVLCDTLNGLEFFNDILYLCTGRGIYRYSRSSDSFVKDHDLAGSSFDEVSINRMSMTPEGEIFLSGFDTRNFDALVTLTSQGHVVFRRQFDFLPDIATRGMAFADGAIWLAKGQSLFVIDKSRLAFRYGAFRTVFTSIISGKDHVILDGAFCHMAPAGAGISALSEPGKPAARLKHSDNSISFGWTTTSYVEETKTEYRYRLVGFDDEWSGWESRNYRDYTNLPSGDYRFLLRAKTITGLEGEEIAFPFSIARPWYFSVAALIVYGIVAGGLLLVLVFNMVRRFRRRRRKLESLLRQRNEAASRGRDEISGMEKYAGMVQRALLPSARGLAEAVNNSFILNRPRGAVSGDFFWFRHSDDRTVIVAGDCTGHGVPSALRTIMAMGFLDEIESRPVKMKTSEMLSEFRNRLAETFTSVPHTDMHLEGIDLSLLVIDRASGKVEFSGAATQCFRVRMMNDREKTKWDNGEFRPNEGTMASGKYLLETVYGDRVPLGMHLDGDHVFTQHTWKLERESSYYLFTDGYPDQFNGSTGKKFLKKNLRRLILDIQNFHMEKQKEILEERLDSWMGQAPQTDDILIVGLRIE